MIKLIVKVYFFLCCLNSFSQTTYTWSSVAATSSWNTSTNWIPIGIPQSTDNVVIVNSINSPLLPGNTTINNLTTTSGSLDLSSNTLTINGISIFNSGIINNGSILSTGSSSVFISTIFNANVTANCTRITLDGGVFNGVTTIQKNGSGNDVGSGGSIFNGVTTISNNGTAYLRMGNSTGDIFNNSVTFSNSNSSYIDIGYGGGTTQLNESIIVNSTAGTGIRFGQGTGLVSLASGKIISAGTFTSGRVELRNFTQLGLTAQNLTLTGTSIIYFETNTTFNGSLTAISPQVFLNGSTFNGITYIEKTGATNNTGLGGNTFESVTTIRNSGTANFISGNASPDIFNGKLSLICTDSGRLYLAHMNGTTQINEDVDVSSSSAGGIYFGNTSGLTTLANGKTITIGAGGFSGSGTLSLKNFTQIGSTPQDLMLSGTSALTIGPISTFNGNVNFSAPQILLNGCIYSGTTIIEKNGASNNSSKGSNIFNSITQIKNSGTGIMYLANLGSDDFNASVTFVKTGTGLLYPAYNTTCTFSGDISTIGSLSAITFASSDGGRVEIDGNIQSFFGASTQTPIVKRLTISGGGNLTLNVPVSISTGGDITMTSGKIISTSTNILTLLDESVTSTIGNENSYINGPMVYKMTNNGSSVLNFPIGKDFDWRPVIISPIHNTVTSYSYTSEVINSSATMLGYTLPSTLDNVSKVRYWDINRSPSINANLTSATVQLYYGTTVIDDEVMDESNLRIAKTLGTGTDWFDIGGVGTVAGIGSIVSSSFASFGTMTLGFIDPIVALPISLVSFGGEKKERSNVITWKTFSEKNNDYFTIERSLDGFDFETISIIDGAGNSPSLIEYSIEDQSFPAEINYYRLKQTDFDGGNVFSSMISIDNRIDSKKINKIINLIGVEVDEHYKGMVIIVYSDNSKLKTIQNL